ncbi:MAG: DUF2441 domain-containing protein [Clostridia bacterium]|nr:DUF2441 domain-containing protein [Clostridia bacterium]
MEVKDLILYQVATNRDFKVGDIITFQNEPNGQYEKVFNLNFNLNGQPIHKVGFDSLNKGLFKNKELIVNMSKALSNYDFIIRELALEEVRKEKFPNLPSRFSCMFLSDTEEVCLQNYKDFIASNKNKTYQAIKVKVTGEAHYVKDFGIGRLGLSFNEYKQEAEKYWSQNQNSTTPTKEILFSGQVEIIEILEEYKILDSMF